MELTHSLAANDSVFKIIGVSTTSNSIHYKIVYLSRSDSASHQIFHFPTCDVGFSVIERRLYGHSAIERFMNHLEKVGPAASVTYDIRSR